MSVATILDYTVVALVFLAIISILVAAHEYGHYYFARLFGMGVEEFAIGMGKKLKVLGRKSYEVAVPADYRFDPTEISKGMALEGGNIRKDDSEVVETPNGRVLRESTEFTVRMLPIGGFVRIKGMIPQEDGSEVNIPGGFYSKPPWQRLVVLFAGPVASVLSGVLVLIAVFMIFGANRPSQEPVIAQVATDGPAAAAGLRPGDRIVSIDGKKVEKFYDFVEVVYASPGREIEVTYQRGNRVVATAMTPRLEEGYMLGPDMELVGPEMKKRGVVGVGHHRRRVQLGLGEATLAAVRLPLEALKGLARITVQPTRLKDEAGGAVTMVAATYAATQAGLAYVIELACLLSISIGIFNLLPVPPLDGGQMLMAFVELLRRGRRLSIQVQQAMMSAGLTLVFLLTAVVLYIDIQRFTGSDKRPPAPQKQTQPEQQKKDPARAAD